MTQQGHIEGEGKCLTITRMVESRPIGSQQEEWAKQSQQDEHDVVIVFKNIVAARVIQDELNELIAIWSRELSEKVSTPVKAKD